ncbi:MAG: LUD domain-containing protein [Desulfobulbaceae bacterium]|nr:LUD domain-containing protein [Desulfobulbaceae bacterium]
MVANRTAAITFGPRHMIICVGGNKPVHNATVAWSALNTPCVKISRCMNCKSPDRICNTWIITEKSCPKHRIRVILINQD